MDGLFKQLIPLKEIRLLRLPLLIAYAHHGEAEGFPVAHLYPDSSPRRALIPVCKLNEIQRILQEFLKFRTVSGHHLIGLILAGKPHVQHGQGLGSDQLTEQEIFVISQSQCLVIMAVDALIAVLFAVSMHRPAVPVVPSGPLGLQTVLEPIAVGQRVTLHDAAAGKAQESGPHVLQQLKEIPAEDSADGVCGKQRNKVKLHRARL